MTVIRKTKRWTFFGTQCIITTADTILIQNQIAIRFNHDLNLIGDSIETLKDSIQRALGIHSDSIQNSRQDNNKQRLVFYNCFGFVVPENK